MYKRDESDEKQGVEVDKLIVKFTLRVATHCLRYESCKVHRCLGDDSKGILFGSAINPNKIIKNVYVKYVLTAMISQDLVMSFSRMSQRISCM